MTHAEQQDPKLPSREMTALADAAGAIARVVRISGARPDGFVAKVQIPGDTLRFLARQWGALPHEPLTINTGAGYVRFEAAE